MGAKVSILSEDLYYYNTDYMMMKFSIIKA